MNLHPKLQRVKENTKLSIGLLNNIIGRIEYASDLIRNYNPNAGTNITLERTPNGVIINAEALATYSIVVSATTTKIALVNEYDLRINITWTVTRRVKGVIKQKADTAYKIYSYINSILVDSQPMSVFTKSFFSTMQSLGQNPYASKTITSALNYNGTKATASVTLNAITETIEISLKDAFEDGSVTIQLDIGQNLSGSYINLYVNNIFKSVIEKTGLSSFDYEIQNINETDTAYAEIWWGNTLLATSNTISLEVGVDVFRASGGVFTGDNFYNPSGVFPAFDGKPYFVTTPFLNTGTYTGAQIQTAYAGSFDGIVIAAGCNATLLINGVLYLSANGPKIVNNGGWKGSIYDSQISAGNGYGKYWGTAQWYNWPAGNSGVGHVWYITKGSKAEFGVQ